MRAASGDTTGVETSVSAASRREQDQWFESLWDRHAGAVYAYSARRVGPHAADDVVADTFAVVFRQGPEASASGRPWIIGIARNIVRNLQRGSARTQRLHLKMRMQHVDDVASAEAQVVGHRSVHDALNELKEVDAEILVLSTWEGLSSAEIATIVGLSPAAVRMRLTRSRRDLARWYAVHHRSDEKGVVNGSD